MSKFNFDSRTTTIKLSYWNMYIRQLPKLWSGCLDDQDNLTEIWKPKHVIRVVGHSHSLDNLRWLYQIAYTYPDYIFLIFTNSMDDMQALEFPHNVIPVLQVDSKRRYADQVTDYLDLCADRGVLTPTLSIFCNDAIYVDTQVKWLLLSGLSSVKIENTISMNSRNRKAKIPIYVERFAFKKSLPPALNLREYPGSLLQELMETNHVEESDKVCQEAFNTTAV